MPRLHLLHHPAEIEDSAPSSALPLGIGLSMLSLAGVCWGRVAAPAFEAASEPRMRHAHALVDLQRRFGQAARIVRERGVQGGGKWWPEADQGVGLGPTLVVAGSLAWVMPAPALGGHLLCRWQALEWFALSPQLRGTVQPRRSEPDAEWLVLHAGPPGGMPERFVGTAWQGDHPGGGQSHITQAPGLRLPALVEAEA